MLREDVSMCHGKRNTRDSMRSAECRVFADRSPRIMLISDGSERERWPQLIDRIIRV